MSERSRYAGFTVRTECNHCGNPLPLHGPVLSTLCPKCLQEAQVPASAWRVILEAFDEEHGSLAPGQGAVSSALVDGLSIRHEHKKHLPACEKCAAPFSVEQLPVGTSMDFSCTQCGDPANTQPVPAWLQALVPSARQFYSTDPATRAGNGLSLDAERAIKPVAMACPSCGGSLAATTESERIMVCRFCQTDVYLPDEVWRRLHPVVTVQEWFIRFEGLTRSQRAAVTRARDEAQKRDAANAKRAAADQRKRAAVRRNAAIELDQALALRREIAGMKWPAYVASVLFVLSLLGVFGLGRLKFLGTTPVGLDLNELILPLLGVAVVLLVLALALGARPIQRATGNNGSWMVFCIWFWVPFALAMPVVGQIMALARAFILFRGEFGASTITSNNAGTESYAAVTLENHEGRPAALVFLALALLYPLTMASVFAPQAVDSLLHGDVSGFQSGEPDMPQTEVRGLGAPGSDPADKK